MKKYLQTHPWLTFKIDLKRASAELWLLLGEASSKCEHLANVPLRPTTAEKLHQLYLAKGVAATTAIEGNTLSEAEVLQAVEGKLKVPPSKAYLKQEIDNIIEACNLIGTQLAAGKLPAITPALLCEYDRMVLNKLPLEEDVRAGEFREHSVVVGTVYRGAPAIDCPYLAEHLCEWLNGPDFTVQDKAPAGRELVFAIVKAVVAHIYFAWIHPFGDGNGRTARLLEFHILLSAGVPSPAAHLLSNHYNQTRTEYYRQLEFASKSGGDIMPFLMYAVRGFVDGLRSQLEYVWDQQWDVVWLNYVHMLFQHKTSPSDVRQRNLALDLGARRDWVPIADIAELTPRMAKAYAGKTPKTIQRDLNVLKKFELIAREDRKVRARREIIQSFLPLRHKPDQQAN
jgi:cell filamentation protein, protein adenylyltransferase